MWKLWKSGENRQTTAFLALDKMWKTIRGIHRGVDKNPLQVIIRSGRH